MRSGTELNVKQITKLDPGVRTSFLNKYCTILEGPLAMKRLALPWLIMSCQGIPSLILYYSYCRIKLDRVGHFAMTPVIVYPDRTDWV